MVYTCARGPAAGSNLQLRTRTRMRRACARLIAALAIFSHFACTYCTNTHAFNVSDRTGFVLDKIRPRVTVIRHGDRPGLLEQMDIDYVDMREVDVDGNSVAGHSATFAALFTVLAAGPYTKEVMDEQRNNYTVECIDLSAAVGGSLPLARINVTYVINRNATFAVPHFGAAFKPEFVKNAVTVVLTVADWFHTSVGRRLNRLVLRTHVTFSSNVTTKIVTKPVVSIGEHTFDLYASGSDGATVPRHMDPLSAALLSNDIGVDYTTVIVPRYALFQRTAPDPRTTDFALSLHPLVVRDRTFASAVNFSTTPNDTEHTDTSQGVFVVVNATFPYFEHTMNHTALYGGVEEVLETLPPVATIVFCGVLVVVAVVVGVRTWLWRSRTIKTIYVKKLDVIRPIVEQAKGGGTA